MSKGNHRADVRPSWDDYFLAIAHVVSSRSLDANTHHGAVLVDENNHIVGTGYNSFVRDIDNYTLPNDRKSVDENGVPNKYKWMIHSEINACLNSHRKGVKCYVTGKCCLNCLQYLWQYGVEEVVMGCEYGWGNDEKQRLDWALFIELTGMKVRYHTANLSWVKEMFSEKST